jgi:GNAT superfamily N-acetyltransferase
MKFRNYKPTDHKACLKLFDSNCPPFFDESERLLFDNWLLAFDTNEVAHANINKSLYYVGELNEVIICCGGIYSLKEKNEVRLSWGMVLREYHQKGYGKTLLKYRLEEFNKHFSGFNLKLDTSQLTVGFYKQMNFRVTKIEKDGYGVGLDRYDMDYQNMKIDNEPRE